MIDRKQDTSFRWLDLVWLFMTHTPELPEQTQNRTGIEIIPVSLLLPTTKYIDQWRQWHHQHQVKHSLPPLVYILYEWQKGHKYWSHLNKWLTPTPHEDGSCPDDIHRGGVTTTTLRLLSLAVVAHPSRNPLTNFTFTATHHHPINHNLYLLVVSGWHALKSSSAKAPPVTTPSPRNHCTSAGAQHNTRYPDRRRRRQSR